MPELPASLVHWNGTDHLVSDVGVAPFGIYSFIVSARYNDTPMILCGTGPGAGDLYEWNPPFDWIPAATFWNNGGADVERIINSLVVFNGEIYGKGVTTGRMFICPAVMGGPWVPVTPYNVNTSDGSKIVLYHGHIYCGGGDGKLRRWNGVNDWVVVAAAPPSGDSVPEIIIFNDKIFGAGGLFLYYWNGTDAWVQVTLIVVGIIHLLVNNGALFGVDGFGNLYKLGTASPPFSNVVKKKLFISGAI